MANFKNVVNNFKNIRVLVIGDIILDQFTYGTVTRVAPEAPVPILKKTHETFNLGGAANLARNAATLGAKVTLVGVIGEDEHKDKVISLLRKHHIGSCMLVDPDRATTLKNRFVTAGTKQLVRLDEEHRVPLTEKQVHALVQQLCHLIEASEVVVFSDYGNGMLTESLVSQIFEKAHTHGVHVIADVKPKNKALFLGVDVVCVNKEELFHMTGALAKESIESVGRMFMNEMQSAVLVKRGVDGVSVFDRDGVHTHIPAKKITIADTTGVRDTFSAGVALSLASGLSVVDSARLANVAANIVVRKPGVATIFVEELRSALGILSDVEDVAIVPKLWGYEKWLENNDRYCCKLLVLKRGYQCSLHYHKNKDEMFLVTEGQVRMEIEEEVYHMMPGHYIRLKPGTNHRFTGVEDSIIVEISTTHREEDSHRIEKAKVVPDITQLLQS